MGKQSRLSADGAPFLNQSARLPISDANLHILKYFTYNSLFLKDLAR